MRNLWRSFTCVIALIITSLFAGVPLLLAQVAEAPSAGEPIWKQFISMTLPFLIGPLSSWLYDHAQLAWKLLEKIPPVVRPFVAASLAFGGTALAGKLGVVLGVYDPTQWGSTEIAALLSAVASFIFKSGKNQKNIAKTMGVDLKQNPDKPGSNEPPR